MAKFEKKEGILGRKGKRDLKGMEITSKILLPHSRMDCPRVRLVCAELLGSFRNQRIK